MRVDLHLHSTLSDGTMTPEEVVSWAGQAELDVFAITDHDAISGVARAEAMCPPGLRLIRGIELSSRFEDTEYHILGYFPDEVGPEFIEYLDRAQSSRGDRMTEGLEALRKRGLSVTMEDLRRHHPESESVSRNHVAQFLFESGQVDSLQDAFDRHLRYTLEVIPRTPLTAVEAIALIRRHAGVPVWAHPTTEMLDANLGLLREAGLEGVEVYTRRRSAAETAHCVRAASEAGLLMTAGSDWHGNGRNPKLFPVKYDISNLEPFLGRFSTATRVA